MDTPKKTRNNAIGLGALSALLGVTSKGANSYAKNLSKLQIDHLKNMSKIPEQIKIAKMARNVAGVGAAGAGIGGAVLAAKYFKNKKAGVK